MAKTVAARDDLGGERGRPRVTAAAAVAAALTYSAFLAGPLWQSRLNIADSFPSELEAVGQPHAAWFRLADAVSGILIVVAVHGVYRMRGVGGIGRPGTIAMAAVGAASIVDGITTMGCAPSLSSACRARDTSLGGLLGQVLEAHTLSGLIGFVGAAVGMVWVGFDLRGRSRSWAMASIGLGFALAAIGLVDLLLLLAGGPFGYAERARDVAVSLWLAGCGAFIWLPLDKNPPRANSARTAPMNQETRG